METIAIGKSSHHFCRAAGLSNAHGPVDHRRVDVSIRAPVRFYPRGERTDRPSLEGQHLDLGALLEGELASIG